MYLPVMLDCAGRRCVVVGGGAVGERKVYGLLEAGADVEVVSPAVTDRLMELDRDGSIRWSARTFQPEDVSGAFLVYAATDLAEVNDRVAEVCHAAGVPVNVTSRAESGSFITPRVIRRGRLTVAVSTSGAGPAAAGRIAAQLEQLLGPEYEPYLDFLHHLRGEIKRREPSPEARARLLRLLAEMDLLKAFREGKLIEWSPEEISSWIAENRGD